MQTCYFKVFKDSIVNVTQQTFFGLEDVFKTSWKYILKTSWRRLENVFKTSCEMSSRRLQDVFARHLQEVLKTSWKTKNCYAEDVFKACLEDVLRRLGDKQNVYWNICIKQWPTNKSNSVFNKSISHKSRFHQSKANPNCIN